MQEVDKSRWRLLEITQRLGSAGKERVYGDLGVQLCSLGCEEMSSRFFASEGPAPLLDAADFRFVPA